MAHPFISVDSIRSARRRAAGIVKTTPLDLSTTFSALCGCEIHLKLENLQKTGSFKVRGALNKIQLLAEGKQQAGVITASAGNHAQGVAYAGHRAGVPVTVVMPELASFSKIAATEGYGAEVVLAGRDYAEAYEHAAALGRERSQTFVHAFDDAEVITGQGTLGLEIIEQLPDVDTIVVPVGGGGLLSGIISALRGVGHAARIVAVQAAGAATLADSLRSGKPVQCPSAETIADGLATRSVGTLPFEILQAAAPEVVDVADADIAAAVLLLLERAKTVVEGAGAVGMAACLNGKLPAGAKKVAVVLSGGNIDMNLLDRIINLGLATEGRLFRFSTRLGDRPGELQRLVTLIASQNANIRQIEHHRARPGLPLTRTDVFLEIEVQGHDHIARIRRALAAEGFRVEAGPEP
jgi:threonine dehydratase